MSSDSLLNMSLK